MKTLLNLDGIERHGSSNASAPQMLGNSGRLLIIPSSAVSAGEIMNMAPARCFFSRKAVITQGQSLFQGSPTSNLFMLNVQEPECLLCLLAAQIGLIGMNSRMLACNAHGVWRERSATSAR